MSGHSHWATIRRKKSAIDSKRGRMFSKLARRVTMAARQGGGSIEGNFALQFAVEEARAVSMPKDTIDRAIKKGAGELGAGEELAELRYEGYAFSGVALLIIAVTDNKNRTASDVRHILEKAGGSLGGVGSTAWLFDSKGLIQVAGDAADEDTLLGIALEAGAEDMERVGDAYQITCAPGDLGAVRRALVDREIPVASAEVTFIPQTTVPLDVATGRRMLQLMETLEENDDVQNVYANFELPAELLQEEAG